MDSAVTGTEGKWMRSSGPGSGLDPGLEWELALGAVLGKHDGGSLRMEVILNRYWRNWLVV